MASDNTDEGAVNLRWPASHRGDAKQRLWWACQSPWRCEAAALVGVPVTVAMRSSGSGDWYPGRVSNPRPTD
jgi:hypothetical protein